MKHLLVSSVVAVLSLASVPAMAQQTYWVQAPPPPPRYKFIGMSFDVGVPSGAALGLELRAPFVPWFKLNGAFTYTLAPGARVGLVVDPIKFPVVPLGVVDVGYQSPISVNASGGTVGGSFTYEDFMGGLGFGSRDGFRFMLLAGETHLDGNVTGLASIVNTTQGVTYGDPKFHGWVPCARLGFSLLF